MHITQVELNSVIAVVSTAVNLILKRNLSQISKYHNRSNVAKMI